MTNDPATAQSHIDKEPFGHLSDGTAIERFILRNRQGMQARIATYGGVVTHLSAPDREGKFADVVLGYSSLDGYVTDTQYLGALIGRYGNRIAHGKFTLKGREYALAQNDGPNALHGG